MTSVSPDTVSCRRYPSSRTGGVSCASRAAISRAAAATSAGEDRPSRTAPSSLLCTTSRETALTTTGKPRRAAASAAASGVETMASRATGTPYARSHRVAGGKRARARHGARQARRPRHGRSGLRLQRVVLGEERQHAQRILGPVEVELADLTERLARAVGRRTGREDDHHRLVDGLGRFRDEPGTLSEKRHRGEDGQTVGDVRVVEEEPRGLPADFHVLRGPAAAEVNGVIRLWRQEQLAERGARLVREHGLLKTELAQPVARDARPAARGREDGDAAAPRAPVPDQEVGGAHHVVWIMSDDCALVTADRLEDLERSGEARGVRDRKS